MSDEAAELYRRVCTAYSWCGSYRDSGEVAITFFGDTARTDRRPFSTRFARTQGLLFEFRSRVGPCSGWTQSAAWTEGRQARLWGHRHGIRSPGSLGLALAALTGVSGGSAHRVPRLLLPDLLMKESPLPRPRRLFEDPVAASQGCVVIETEFHSGEVEHLWIEQATCLIRRAVTPRRTLAPLPADAYQRALESMKRHLGPQAANELLARMREDRTEVESVTTYLGAFDAPVNPEEVRFTPPESSV